MLQYGAFYADQGHTQDPGFPCDAGQNEWDRNVRCWEPPSGIVNW